MTQAIEPVFFAKVQSGGGTETPCDHSAPKTGWRCVLQGKTASHLVENISRDRKIKRPTWPAPNGSNSLADVSRSKRTWPHEAHHLIPWQQLKKHPVRQFLKKGSKLLVDANYSVVVKAPKTILPAASAYGGIHADLRARARELS